MLWKLARVTFNVLAALSLVLCVLWVRSSWVEDQRWWSGGSLRGLRFEDEQLRLDSGRGAVGLSRRTQVVSSVDPSRARAFADGRGTDSGFSGLSHGRPEHPA